MLQFFWLGLVRSTQNFVCYAKKSVNRRPLLRLTIFFTNQNFLNCQQTSKIPSRIRGGLKFFCQATKSFVLWHEYLFFRIILFCAHDHFNDFSGYSKNFACQMPRTRVKNEKLVITKISLWFGAKLTLWLK